MDYSYWNNYPNAMQIIILGRVNRRYVASWIIYYLCFNLLGVQEVHTT